MRRSSAATILRMFGAGLRSTRCEAAADTTTSDDFCCRRTSDVVAARDAPRSSAPRPSDEPLRVTLIEGHGTGPAVCAAVRRVFDAAAVPVQWDAHATHSLVRDPLTGRQTVDAGLLRSAEATGLVLRGPHTGLPQSGSDGSPALALHKALDAHIGVRMFASTDGHRPYGRVRVVNIRDTVSGEYSEIEHTVVPGVVQTIKTTQRTRSEAVARFAFEYAAANGHYLVTALHKANVMPLSDGVFLRACRRVSRCYPAVDYAEEKLDTFALRVTADPDRYDVLVTPSLYGALASAACSALCGGVYTVPSAAFGRRAAVFGTMDDSGGYGSRGCGGGVYDPADAVNPTGLIRSAAWMLAHAGLTAAALRIDTALRLTIRQHVLTRDMGGTASCEQFTDAVVRNLLDPDARAAAGSRNY